jgi:tRNA(Ser,Leu) C12 N-acetylase TAN1
MYNGVRVTTVARAIVDSAATGTDPSQIQRAVDEALARGVADPSTVRVAARRHANQHRFNVQHLIEEALSSATQRTWPNSSELPSAAITTPS